MSAIIATFLVSGMILMGLIIGAYLVEKINEENDHKPHM